MDFVDGRANIRTRHSDQLRLSPGCRLKTVGDKAIAITEFSSLNHEKKRKLSNIIGAGSTPCDAHLSPAVFKPSSLTSTCTSYSHKSLQLSTTSSSTCRNIAQARHDRDRSCDLNGLSCCISRSMMTQGNWIFGPEHVDSLGLLDGCGVISLKDLARFGAIEQTLSLSAIRSATTEKTATKHGLTSNVCDTSSACLVCKLYHNHGAMSAADD